MSWRRAAWILGAVLGLAVGVPTGGRALASDATRDAVRALRERDDRERAILLERALREVRTVDDVDGVLRRVLPKVRNALDTELAVRALARVEDLDALERIAHTAGEHDDVARRLVAVEALGRSDAEAAGDLLRTLQFDDHALVRAAVTTSLGEVGALDDDVSAAAALGDADWRVRSAAIWALARDGWEPPEDGTFGFDPVPLLLRRMRAEQGRLVDDCAEALSNLLGERYGARPEAYAELWARRTGRDVEPPGESAEIPAPTLLSPLFSTRSKRILFALSVGQSMEQEITPPRLSGSVKDLLVLAGEDLVEDHAEAETKLDLARVHLRAMIRLLADGTHFDVAVYADSPTFAFGELVAADDRSRQRAEARVASLSPGGGGNLSEMLRRAFDPRGKEPGTAEGGPDTIVLFSDGRLAAPGLTDRNQVNLAVRRWNRVRQIRFVVVGLTPADESVLGPLGGGPPRGIDVRLP